MTMLPESPFLDPTQPVGPEAPTPFQIDEEVFWHAIDPTWSWGFEDDPPLFLTDPSPDFIEACHRDLLPLLECAARLA